MCYVQWVQLPPGMWYVYICLCSDTCYGQAVWRHVWCIAGGTPSWQKEEPIIYFLTKQGFDLITEWEKVRVGRKMEQSRVIHPDTVWVCTFFIKPLIYGTADMTSKHPFWLWKYPWPIVLAETKLNHENYMHKHRWLLFYKINLMHTCN